MFGILARWSYIYCNYNNDIEIVAVLAKIIEFIVSIRPIKVFIDTVTDGLIAIGDFLFRWF